MSDHSIKCTNCRGRRTDLVPAGHKTGGAYHNIRIICPVCNGDGREHPFTCPTCGHATSGASAFHARLAMGEPCLKCYEARIRGTR